MALDPLLIPILWRRIIAATDEAAAGLIRTSYSSMVRDYYDFACAVFDSTATMIAHSNKSTAGFIGIIPEVTRNLVKVFPPETLKPGDVLVTNDPWLATGHLPDITCVTPIFRNDRLVGYAMCIVHHLDIGGRANTTESRDVYEEGLKIPPLKLFEAGKANDTIFEFIRANVRVSDRVLGDLKAQLIANRSCAAAIDDLLTQYGLDDLEELTSEITSRSERSLRAEIAKLPDGTYRNEVLLPPVGKEIEGVRVKVAISINGDDMTVDFTGSSGQVSAAMNVTWNNTRSYALYPVKALLDPEVPNNDGCLRAIKVIAPEGSVLNCRFPAPVWGRTLVTHNLPEIVMGALADVIPDKIIASCGATPGNMTFFHGRKREGRNFVGVAIHFGGFGASKHGDGETGLSFPFNSGNIPIEISEIDAAIFYTRKELLVDSGGPGEFRGGLGQLIELRIPDGDLGPDGPVVCGLRGSSRFPDSTYPVFGRLGGGPGRGAGLYLNDEAVAHGLQWQLKPGDTVRLSVPGGGGFGCPLQRDPHRVIDDVRLGLVSRKGALDDYGVVLTDAMEIDWEKTKEARDIRSKQE